MTNSFLRSITLTIADIRLGSFSLAVLRGGGKCFIGGAGNGQHSASNIGASAQR